MSSEPDHEFRPLRTENVLNDEPRDLHPSRSMSHTIHTSISMSETYPGSTQEESHRRHRDESVERPVIMPSSSSTDVEDESDLERIQTTQSVRDRRAFEPIRSGDREELTRIASSFRGDLSLARTRTHESSALERQDTLAGVNVGDPVLDPKSPEFDVYKWTRM